MITVQVTFSNPMSSKMSTILHTLHAALVTDGFIIQQLDYDEGKIVIDDGVYWIPSKEVKP